MEFKESLYCIMNEARIMKKIPRKLVKYLPPLTFERDFEDCTGLVISSSTKSRGGFRKIFDSGERHRGKGVNKIGKDKDAELIGLKEVNNIGVRDCETNTDTEMQYGNETRFGYISISNKKFSPGSPLHKSNYIKSLRQSQEPSYKSITPVVPHTQNSNSIKSISPIMLMADFEVGRSKSFEKKSIKMHSNPIKNSKAPFRKSLGLGQKFLKKIVIRSILKHLN